MPRYASNAAVCTLVYMVGSTGVAPCRRSRGIGWRLLRQEHADDVGVAPAHGALVEPRCAVDAAAHVAALGEDRIQRPLQADHADVGLPVALHRLLPVRAALAVLALVLHQRRRLDVPPLLHPGAQLAAAAFLQQVRGDVVQQQRHAGGAKPPCQVPAEAREGAERLHQLRQALGGEVEGATAAGAAQHEREAAAGARHGLRELAHRRHRRADGQHALRTPDP
mmetsp:Transcript_27341/g.70972  ORF Transcript_27341/g.70972 Transcript_27341/m.70972 type:complete len:223 (+) Transcript_27341:81-749(+)